MADAADRRDAGLVRRGASFLGSLDPTEVLLLGAALAALPMAALGLRLVGLQRMQRWLDHPVDAADGPGADGGAAQARARRLARIVGAAARYGPWPANCLQRSLVLWWYLRAHRLDSDLRIGVRRHESGSGLAFHAWVERESEVLNDNAAVRSIYATFDRAIAPPRARFT